MSHHPRFSKVKNKQPAPIQITAEQILREASERQEPEYRPPQQKIYDEEELADHRLRKRKGFEDAVRRNRYHFGHWLKYAQWEEEQKDLVRARSVFERVLEIDYKNPTVWVKYAEMEIRCSCISHARNVWDRAVGLLPRVDQLWLKYTHMEEVIGNFAGARQIFERWMEWQPEELAWNMYVKFERRHGEVERARNILERLISVHPKLNNWMRLAKFERKLNETERARQVYQKCLEVLAEQAHVEEFFIEFAQFEQSANEYERARVIFRYALDHVPKQRAVELFKRFIAFEKQFGNRVEIESAIINKRRFEYEQELKNNGTMNYDVWFDYIRLEEADGDSEKIRQVYERAIANVPPTKDDKRYWRRYIYLWINYALWEELEAKSVEKTREIYRTCLRLVPHDRFTFKKLWVMFAHFEIRQKNLQAMRKVLGQAIGQCPHAKLFGEYIELESKLGQLDRCRKIYEKWLEWAPASCSAWCKYAQLETTLREIERARAIYQLAIEQPMLDMPEIVWKSFIDFEIENEEYDHARQLYVRLIERTKHIKVWLSWAGFEESVDRIDLARLVFEQAYAHFKALTTQSSGAVEVKQERAELVDAWRTFEMRHGDKQTQSEVAKKIPNKVKKRRQIKNEDGTDAYWEEYYDYLFPDDEVPGQSLKILEMARKWKREKSKEAQ